MTNQTRLSHSAIRQVLGHRDKDRGCADVVFGQAVAHLRGGDGRVSLWSKQGVMINRGKTKKLGEKLVPVSLCYQQVRYDFANFS
jgi:hypothetical protein